MLISGWLCVASASVMLFSFVLFILSSFCLLDTALLYTLMFTINVDKNQYYFFFFYIQGSLANGKKDVY